MWWIWTIACEPHPQARPGPGPVPTSPPSETVDTAGTTVDTTPTPGDTASPPPLDYPAAPPPAVDCAAAAVGPQRAAPTDGDPVPFDTRADGLSWFASGAITEGTGPDAATVVYDLGGDLVRQDPAGVLWWVAVPDVLRAIDGVPAIHTTGLQGYPRVPLDLEVHPYGSLLIPQFEVGTGDTFVSFVDPAGAMTTTRAPLAVRDVVWATDWRSVWITTQQALFTAPVDPIGRPDWSLAAHVADVPAPEPEIVDDLAVDGCGRLYLTTQFFTAAAQIWQYDPALGTFTELGLVDHGYGRSPLRFGRAPGLETSIGTLSGGWSTIEHHWVTWDVGVSAPLWP